jgi:uncharacterized protein (TIGR03437 family)
VVNAASWSETISPGSLFSIFGSNLAARQASASAPLPLTLAGTSVTINGIPAPLAFVSPGQINAQVPSSLTAPAHEIIAVALLVTTSAGSAGIQTGLASAAPGFFTADASGCGQTAALNIRPDGAVSVNSPSNSAAPGDYIALFGTGFGLPVQHLDDGAAATGPSSLSVVPALTVNDDPIPLPSYGGLAPGLAGVDQINFQVPATMRNGCAVPVAAGQGLFSLPVTLSIQNGGGQCTDPPIQSYGQISLTSLVGVPDADFFSARFPAAPNLTPPAPEKVVYAPDFVANTGGVYFENSTFPYYSPPSCAVPGYTSLSAGSIQITSPFAIPATFEPFADGDSGVVYSGNLPSGFVRPGVYTVTGTAAASVGLHTNMTIGAPIQIQTPLPPGTVISSSQPLTLRWTGGDPDSLVRLTLTSMSADGTSTGSYTYGHASDGSLTMIPACTFGNPLNPKFCSFGIPASSNASITVQVMPDPSKIPTVSVPGITGPVSLTWNYAYGFRSLVLAP